MRFLFFFFFQAEDGIRDADVTGVQTCALPISGCTALLMNAIRLSWETSSTRCSRSEEHTSELQSRPHLVCRLLLEKKKTTHETPTPRLQNNQTLRTCAPNPNN